MSSAAVTRFRIQVRGRYGFIDRAGQEIIAPTFRDVHHFSCGLAAFRADDGLYGFMDDRGSPVISARFARAEAFLSDRAVVMLNGKMAVIDRAGTFLIEPTFDALSDHNAHVVVAKVDGGACLLSKSGAQISARYDEIGRVDEDGFAIVRKGKVWGLLDRTGAESIAPGHAQFGFGAHEDRLSFREGTRWGLVDRAGHIVLGPSLAEIDEFSFGRSRAKSSTKYGYIDRAGVFAVPERYAAAYVFREERGAVCTHAGESWGFIDVDGNEVVPEIYEQASVYSGGLARVRSKGKIGCLDSAGRVVIEPKYDEIALPRDGFARVTKDGLMGFVSVDGTSEIQASFRSAADFNQGLAQVDDGYIDGSGAWIWRRPKMQAPVFTRIEAPKARDYQKVRLRIAEMAKADPACAKFGARKHRYQLRPVLTEDAVAAFEKMHGVVLPEDYRDYVLTLANGGAGPYYGIFPLERSLPQTACLAEPFVPLSHANAVKNAEQNQVDDAAGLLAIADEGCAHTAALIITGKERGTIWTCLDWGWLPVTSEWQSILEACHLDYDAAYAWTLDNLEKVPRTSFYDWLCGWVES